MSTNPAPTPITPASRHLALLAAGTLSPSARTSTQQLAAAVVQIGADVGWALSVWGASPSSFGWPREHYHDLTEHHVEANHPLRALFHPTAAPIDVLYLPSLTSLSLIGVVDPIPASVVVGVPELDIPADPARAERFRLHVQKLFAVASAVIVPTAALRDQVLTEFTLAPECIHIIASPNTLRSEIAAALDYLACFAHVTDQPYLTRPRLRTKPMVSRAERVLYLLNHTTLKGAELPVIRALGLEVYASKLISGQSSFRSGSVDYADNDESTLPRWVLAELDRHNFYDDVMTPEFASLLNDHFDVVICTALNNLIEQLMQHFDGHIVVRAFGREAPLTYAQVFTSDRPNFWGELWRKLDRIWLGAGYDSIIDHEPAILRQNAVMLPLTMPDALYAETGTWIGTDPRVYFVCPDIHSAGDYYGKIYRDFKANFGHLPHIIGGRQVIPVDDPNVIGFVTDERMKQYFRELRVMYYHSREPRHLHYHPLEAIVYGMPLIYMNGGLLEHFARRPDLPGACDTYAEANAKLQRILAGDADFTRSVIESQTVILEEFAPEFVRQMWQERFVGRVLSRSLTPDVLPFGRWQSPSDVIPPVPTPDLPLSPDRRILFYGRMSMGDSAYHTTRTWVGQVLAQTENAQWQIDLQWGALTNDSLDPTWRNPPNRLNVTPLAPPTGAQIDLSAFNSVAILSRIDPDNPPPPPVLPLPERPSPPTASYLTLDELYQMVEAYQVVCIPQSRGLLSPNLDLEALTLLPIVVYISDLAHEYGDTAVEIDSPTALSRELVIWSRLAQVLVFPTEAVRDDAVKRYAIPLERTRILPLSYFATASNVPINFALPDRYLLAAVDDPAQDNLDSILETLRILRQRGERLAPLVLVGTGGRAALLSDQPDSPYHHWLQQIIREGQFAVGSDIILIEPEADLDLIALCRRAELCLSVSRTGVDRYGQIAAALRAKSPLLIGNTPFTRQFESVALLEPADDPVALGDALLRILNHPDETAARVAKGAAWIAQQQQQSPQIVQMLEQVAVGRTQSIKRPAVSAQRRVTMALPTAPQFPKQPQKPALVTRLVQQNPWLVRLNTYIVHSILPIFKLTSLKRYQRLEQDLRRLHNDNDVLTVEVINLRSKAGTKSTSATDMQVDLKRLSQRVEDLEARLTANAQPVPMFVQVKLEPSAEVATALSNITSGALLKNDAFYTSLETAFRDSEVTGEQRQHYLSALHTEQATEQQPILDINCGRGELLRLLHKANVPNVGLTLNSTHIEQLRQQGFNVHQQSGIDFLTAQSAACLSAIVGLRMIEQMDLADVERLLQLAMTTLIDDGQILLETVNPYCLATYRTFYLDPTHTRPLPVDLLAMMMWAAGFTDLQVFYQDPILARHNPNGELATDAYKTYALLGTRPKR